MFEQAFENLQKATTSTIQLQQELFKKWVGLWPGVPAPPGGLKEPIEFQQKWAEIVGETVKRQREVLEAQFSAGLRSIEDAFHLAEAKSPEELRAKAVELWQKSFDGLRQAAEAQAREFQNLVARWTELVTRGAA